ncbi:MAG: transglutaminase-like domain-containing protein [Mangrovicoccus sp.]
MRWTGLEITASVGLGDQVLAPAGLATPYGDHADFEIIGGTARQITEASTGQAAFVITAEAEEITLRYRLAPGSGSAYPAAMFIPQPSRYSRAAEALIEEAQAIAPDLQGVARARAIACATAERFTYGHPQDRFNDGLDYVPALGCGLAEGSCVDINTYFIASLRAAGIKTGYVYGCFFPEEKQGRAQDMHCWVVTEIEGATQEWDIAHHLKLGTKTIAPALNPKPGWRIAMSHSMGLCFPEIGVEGLKVLAEPARIKPEGGLAELSRVELRALEAAEIPA